MRNYICCICGKEILSHQGWHHGYDGMNHWLCETLEQRRKSNFHTLEFPKHKIGRLASVMAQPVSRKSRGMSAI